MYKITNKINGKTYIGKHQTENVDDGYMGSGKLIKKAIDKYGLENFSKEILHVFDSEQEMNLKEQELVVLSSNSYNLCPGGKGGFGYINSTAELVEKRDRLTNKRKGYLANKHNMTKPKNVDSKKISAGLKKTFAEKGFVPRWNGKKHSEETKSKMKTSAVGKHAGELNPSYGKIWVTDGLNNKMIPKDDFKEYENLGYRKGRIMLL